MILIFVALQDDAFIRQFATLDETAKEEMKKEKRRIQEQLRRIKRNQEKEKMGLLAGGVGVGTKYGQAKRAGAAAAKQAMKPPKPDLKLKCGACGAKGHMRTNKACPKFVPTEADEPLGNVAMTEQDEEEMEREVMELEGSEELINVDGTKMTLSAKLLKHTEEMRKKTMQVKIPKKLLKGQVAGLSLSKKRRVGMVEHCDYLTKPTYKPTKRRRTDPVILLSSLLEDLVNE